MWFWLLSLAGYWKSWNTPIPNDIQTQGVFVVAIASYVYLVPHVEEPEYVFLKTIIPSRKAARDYGMRQK